MMKRFLFLVLFLIAIPAHADALIPFYSDPFYYVIGISRLDASLGKYHTDQDTYDIAAGYRLGESEFFSLEARAGWSGNAGRVSVDGSEIITLDPALDPVFVAYYGETRYAGMLGRYDIGRNAQNVYGLFGVMDVTIESKGATFGNVVDVSETGIAYGFGMEFGKRVAVTGEFIKGAGTLNEVTWYRLGMRVHF